VGGLSEVRWEDDDAGTAAEGSGGGEGSEA
jgi:hypothetical protein